MGVVSPVAGGMSGLLTTFSSLSPVFTVYTQDSDLPYDTSG